MLSKHYCLDKFNYDYFVEASTISASSSSSSQSGSVDVTHREQAKLITSTNSINKSNDKTALVESKHSTGVSSSSLFGKRILLLIESLINHVIEMKNFNNSNRTGLSGSVESSMGKKFVPVVSDEAAQLYFNEEHEGKTLLHLCCALGLLTVLEQLLCLRSQLNTRNKADDLGLLMSELDLLKLDHHGHTPMVSETL
jgi:hypothetical protein